MKAKIRVKEITPTQVIDEQKLWLEVVEVATLEDNINKFLDEIGDRFKAITFIGKNLAYITYIEEEI